MRSRPKFRTTLGKEIDSDLLHDVACRVASFYEISLPDLLCKSKLLFIEEKSVLSWVLRNVYLASYPSIGKLLMRDHTTIMNRCKSIDNRIKSDVDFSDDLNRLVMYVKESDQGIYNNSYDFSIDHNYKYHVYEKVAKFFHDNQDIKGKVLVSIRVINSEEFGLEK